MFASCDVHEWPEYDLQLDGEHVVNVTVSHNLVMDESNYSYESRGLDATDVGEYCARYIFRVYEHGNTTNCVGDTTIYSNDLTRSDFDVSLKVPSIGKSYDVMVWSDYVDNSSRSDLYYKTSSFEGVTHGEKYVANSDYRDCFHGVFTVAATKSAETRKVTSQATVTLKRPVGKYTIITTDLDEFVSKNPLGRAVLADYKVRVVYSSYTPASVNIFTNDINNVVTNIVYDSPIKADSSDPTRAVLGFDYVLLTMSTSESAGVAIQLYLLAPDGSTKALTSTINVPMQRSRNTLVVGRFLTGGGTSGWSTGSGVGIDYSYSGEYIIFL
jgi:hypothetical protein